MQRHGTNPLLSSTSPHRACIRLVPFRTCRIRRMAYTIAPSQTVLANILLARIPLSDRNHAIRHLAAQVDHDTIGLVAALTYGNPDEQAEQSLLNFLTHSIESGDPSAAASVCLQYPHVRKALLEHARDELDISLATLLQWPRNKGLVVPTSDFEGIVASLARIQLDHSTRSPEDVVRLAVLYLNFMRQIFRTSAVDRPVSISQPIFNALFALLAASTADIASAARDACFAFLAAYKAGTLTISDLDEEPATFHRHVWSYITSLLDHSPHISYHTTAYAIWLRWLNLPQLPGSSRDAMQLDAYWQHILNALASGDIEQRKLCLHILRASLSSMRSNISTKNMVFDAADTNTGSRSVQAEYERFCTVYETIVIGRYFNQAEECMKDLDVLASSQTKVEKSWLLALLEPALSTITQDSIRKMLGNWLMSTDLKPATHAAEFANLLRKSFLPWACQGQLFTGTIKGQAKSLRCEHGIRLAGFIEGLLKNNSADDEVQVRLCITQAILGYLSHNKTRVIPYAVIYLLHGLHQGLEGQAVPCMGHAELEILLDLPTGTAYPEVSRDVLRNCCLELSQLVQNFQSLATTNGDSRLEILAQKTGHLRTGRTPGGAVARNQWHDLDAYLEELRISRHACISGDQFPGACQSLLLLFDSLDAGTVNADHLCQALESVWTELEIQDYPKDTLVMMPKLIIHPICVASSISDESLADMLTSYLSQLHQFCTGKIYLWSPLMTALRVACLKSPSAVSSLPLSDIVIGTANNPPAAKTEFQLEAAAIQLLRKDQPGDRTYSDYYGEHEAVGYAAFFDIVNRLPKIDDELAREIHEGLINPWANQKLPVPVVSRWKTMVQLQIMIMLQEQLLSTMTSSQAQYHMDILHKILAVEPLPRYRLLIEWMICRIIIRHPETGDDVFQRLSTIDHHSNPKYLSSLVKIGLMISCLDNCAEDFAYRLSCRLVALSSSSKIIIRHEAQWSFPILWNVAEARGLSSITNNFACQALNEYIRSLERFSTPPTERLLEFLDPVRGHTLANLLQGEYLRLEPSTAPLVTAVDIHNLLESDKTNRVLPQILPTGCLEVGDAVVAADTTASQEKISAPDQPSPQESKASARSEAVAALQTKGTAYLSANATKSEESTRPTDLIVVGSLVDNAYNLGGLSRIAEIFGASALYMNRPKAVLANKDFISVAVASQNHLPIHELAVDDLVGFLTTKKNEGYSVVGVEQTDRSVLLGSEECKLPAKTLLVMGAEKEGIPALVLGECDVLVEIPQRGVTRSMNVQTACGVVLFEYSRQHHGKGGNLE